MYLDALLLLSGAISAAGVLSGQSVTGTDTSVLSTNTIDNGPLSLGGNQAVDLGAGEPLNVAFSILAAPTVGTSVEFQIVMADNAALSSNLKVLASSGPIVIASLPIKAVVPVKVGRAAPYAPKRYFGARYVLVGAIATLSVSAAVVKDVQEVKNLFNTNGFAVL